MTSGQKFIFSVSFLPIQKVLIAEMGDINFQNFFWNLKLETKVILNILLTKVNKFEKHFCKTFHIRCSTGFWKRLLILEICTREFSH